MIGVEQFLIEIRIARVGVDGILMVVFVQVFRGDLRKEFKDGLPFRDDLERRHVVR